MLATSQRALDLDPNLADAYAAHGQALVIAGRLTEAEQDFTTAIGLDPNLFQSYLFYARLCYLDWRLEEAARLFLKAADVRPDDFHTLGMVAVCHRDLGALDEMRAAARLCLGRARAEIERHPDNPTAAFYAAVALALLGERADALAFASRALALDRDDLIVQYNVACALSLVGEHDRAIDLLERVLPRASADRKAWLRRDSDLAPLRTQPRYLALLSRDGIDLPG
jgi:adenylate cyclase